MSRRSVESWRPCEPPEQATRPPTHQNNLQIADQPPPPPPNENSNTERTRRALKISLGIGRRDKLVQYFNPLPLHHTCFQTTIVALIHRVREYPGRSYDRQDVRESLSASGNIRIQSRLATEFTVVRANSTHSRIAFSTSILPIELCAGEQAYP